MDDGWRLVPDSHSSHRAGRSFSMFGVDVTEPSGLGLGSMGMGQWTEFLHVEIHANWFTLFLMLYFQSIPVFNDVQSKIRSSCCLVCWPSPFGLENPGISPAISWTMWRMWHLGCHAIEPWCHHGNFQSLKSQKKGMQELVSQILWHICFLFFCCWILKTVYDLWTCKSPKWFFRIGKVCNAQNCWAWQHQSSGLLDLHFEVQTPGCKLRGGTPIWGFP